MTFNRKRHRGRPMTRWPERLRIPQNELENVAGEREVWVSLLGLLPETRTKQMRMDGWKK